MSAANLSCRRHPVIYLYFTAVPYALYGKKTLEEIKDIIWQQVKEVNQTLPDVKHIKEIFVTDEPLAKTTTQKVKRYEEMKKTTF